MKIAAVESGMVGIAKALTFCHKHGKVITESALRQAGHREGFMHKHPDGVHQLFSMDGLEMYTKESCVPQGWHTIKDIAAETGAKPNTLYRRVGLLNLEKIRHKGRTYVEKKLLSPESASGGVLEEA